MFMSSLGKEQDIPGDEGEVKLTLRMEVTGVTKLSLDPDAMMERIDNSGLKSLKDSTSIPTAIANCSADIVAVCSVVAVEEGMGIGWAPLSLQASNVDELEEAEVAVA